MKSRVQTGSTFSTASNNFSKTNRQKFRPASWSDWPDVRRLLSQALFFHSSHKCFFYFNVYQKVLSKFVHIVPPSISIWFCELPNISVLGQLKKVFIFKFFAKLNSGFWKNTNKLWVGSEWSSCVANPFFVFDSSYTENHWAAIDWLYLFTSEDLFFSKICIMASKLN